MVDEVAFDGPGDFGFVVPTGAVNVGIDIIGGSTWQQTAFSGSADAFWIPPTILSLPAGSLVEGDVLFLRVGGGARRSNGAVPTSGFDDALLGGWNGGAPGGGGDTVANGVLPWFGNGGGGATEVTLNGTLMLVAGGKGGAGVYHSSGGPEPTIATAPPEPIVTVDPRVPFPMLSYPPLAHDATLGNTDGFPGGVHDGAPGQPFTYHGTTLWTGTTIGSGGGGGGFGGGASGGMFWGSLAGVESTETGAGRTGGYLSTDPGYILGLPLVGVDFAPVDGNGLIVISGDGLTSRWTLNMVGF